MEDRTGPSGELLPAPMTFATKVEASRYLAAVETDMARGQWVDPRGSSVLLSDYGRAWLEERTVRGRPLAPRTTDTYRHSPSVWIQPTLGDLPLDKITPAHVRRWHAHVSSHAPTMFSVGRCGLCACPLNPVSLTTPDNRPWVDNVSI
ncbi:MAG: hypothetical protein H7270_13360 [Dermatophilaceae bacterium]|nr:hypothetical protein [Dermatophilaceae bacterium]